MTIPVDLQTYKRMFLRDIGRNRAAKTIKIYGDAVDCFAEFLDTLPLRPTLENDLVVKPGSLNSTADTQRIHIKEFLIWLSLKVSQRDGEPISGSYQSSIYRGLQAFWKWMVVEGHCENNPTANIEGPKPDAALVPILEYEELRAIVGTCGRGRKRPFVDIRDDAMLRLLADGGLRCSEMLVPLDRLNMNHQTITVIGKGRNGKSKIRTVSFGAKTAAALDLYLLARGRQPVPKGRETDQLWIGRWGAMTASGIYQVVVERGQAAGLTVHPHQFRHTCALHLKMRGEPDNAVMAHLGWDSPTMVTRYAKIANERVASELIKRSSLGDLI